MPEGAGRGGAGGKDSGRTGLSVGLGPPFKVPLAAASLAPQPRRPQGSAFLNLTVFIMSLLTSFSSPTHDSDLGFAYLFSFAHRLVPGARFLVLPTQSSYSGLFFFSFFLQSNLAKKQCLGLTVAFGIIISPGLAWQLPWDLLLASCSLRISLSTLAALRKSSFCVGKNLIVSLQIFKYPLYAMHLEFYVVKDIF